MTTIGDRERLRQQLVRHENIKLRPYLDCCGRYWRDCSCPAAKKGRLTIGVGRNLDDVGLSKDECLYLESNDIDFAIRALVTYPWFPLLDSVRQASLTNLMFNIGPASFAAFKRMIAALQLRDYDAAAAEMLDSKWRSDVGEARAQEVSAQLRSGVWRG